MTEQNKNEVQSREMKFDVNGEDVRLTPNMVKEYLVNGNDNVTDQEVLMFMNLCKYQKLNPFLREAYLVKFKGKPAQNIVSKEAFMKRAENHKQYEGMEAGIIVERDGQMIDIEGAVKLKNDVLVGGWAKIYRADRKVPITSRVSLEEFSKGQATWNSMPLTMIRKSAIVNAQREAFPQELGSMYIEEEAQAFNNNTEAVVEEEIQQNANSETIDMGYEEPQQRQEINEQYQKPQGNYHSPEEPQQEAQPTGKGPDF